MSDSGTELASRIVVTVVACSLVTWQFVETANFRKEAAWLEGKAPRFGGSVLQWFLVVLMLLSALDGLVSILVDMTLLVSANGHGSVQIVAVAEEISLQLVVGKLSQMILSLMIIGLGISGLATQDGKRQPKAIAATTLGLASLFVKRLPAPLVLVAGVYFVQRMPKKTGDKSAGQCGCFSLRCALRPLLFLAIIEAIYASTIVSDDFRQRLEESKRVAHQIVEAQAHNGHRDAAAEEAMMSSLLIFDTMRPEIMLEMAQQQLGEVVQFGTVLALGFSSRFHGPCFFVYVCRNRHRKESARPLRSRTTVLLNFLASKSQPDLECLTLPLAQSQRKSPFLGVFAFSIFGTWTNPVSVFVSVSVSFSVSVSVSVPTPPPCFSLSLSLFLSLFLCMYT